MSKNILIIISFVVLLIGCKNNQTNVNESNNSLKIIDNTPDSEIVDNILIDSVLEVQEIKALKKIEDNYRCQVFEEYKIPEPSKFNFNSKNINPDFSVLFSTASNNEYQTTFSKSIVLGIFTADLVYTNSFQNANYVNNYYKVVVDISYDLGISDAFSENDADLFLNPDNFDTLSIIINRNIQNTCSQLSESKAYDQLPFIVYGGWIESVFLLTNTLIQNPDVTEKLYKQLSNQKNVIGNLIEFFNSILLDAESFDLSNRIQSIITDLEMLKLSFENSYNSSNYILSVDELSKIFIDISMIRKSSTQEPNEKHFQQQQMMQKQSLE
ncbi:MAG: hypothetical protein JXL97_10205 [Bacteroidales bacterium]|nr:hypothetical protein [Bacteroidales bacterium]